MPNAQFSSFSRANKFELFDENSLYYVLVALTIQLSGFGVISSHFVLTGSGDSFFVCEMCECE